MSAAVAEVFDTLTKELVWLHVRWSTYNELYGRDEGRIGFLNEVASGFFWVVQESLYDAVVLGVCRICDSSETGRGKGVQKNMTVRRLEAAALAEGHKLLADSLRLQWDAVASAVQSLREYRHKYVAHLDFQVALQRATFAGPSRLQINEVLAQIGRMLNQVSRFYCDSDWIFDLIVDGDAVQLLRVAEAGMSYIELQESEQTPRVTT